MQAEQLFTHFFRTLGLSTLAFNAQGCARVIFDGKVAVDLEHDPASGELHLRSDLGPLPASGAEALYFSLLQANLQGQQTLGATLAVDEVERQIVLNRTLLLREFGPDDLLDVMQRFCASAGYWRQTLGDLPQTPIQSAADAPAPAFGSFLRV